MNIYCVLSTMQNSSHTSLPFNPHDSLERNYYCPILQGEKWDKVSCIRSSSHYMVSQSLKRPMSPPLQSLCSKLFNFFFLFHLSRNVNRCIFLKFSVLSWVWGETHMCLFHHLISDSHIYVCVCINIYIYIHTYINTHMHIYGGEQNMKGQKCNWRQIRRLCVCILSYKNQHHK